MFKELKREAFEANCAIVDHGLVKLSFGNASALDRSKAVFAIKPSGVAYSKLSPELMVLVDLDGQQLEPGLRPSSDCPTHRRLYTAFENVGGVVHTHSVNATAFAQAGRSIPIVGTTHADFFGGDVPVTRKLRPSEIGQDYEWHTGEVIVELFAATGLSPLDTPAVIVNRHGPFAWGATVHEAVQHAVAVEYVAELAFLSESLNAKLTCIEPELRLKHFARKHGPNAYYGQQK